MSPKLKESGGYLSELDQIIEKYMGKYENDAKKDAAVKAYGDLLKKQFDIENYLLEQASQLESPLTPEMARIPDFFERYFARLPMKARPISLRIAQKLQKGHIVRIRYDRMMILQFIALGGNLLIERPDEKLPRPGKEYIIKSVSKPVDLLANQASFTDTFNFGINVTLEKRDGETGIITEMSGLYGVSWLANEEPGVQVRDEMKRKGFNI